MPKSRTLFVIAFCGCILGNAKLDPWFDDEGSDGNEKGKHYFSDAARSAGWAPLAKDTHIPTPVPTRMPSEPKPYRTIVKLTCWNKFCKIAMTDHLHMKQSAK